MFDVYRITAGHPELVSFVLSLFAGVTVDALVALQRRGFGRGGFGRRRRPSIFGALGTLVFLLVLGPIVVLALIAYLVYGALAGRRRR
jgi:hypothetical protein